MGREGRHLGVVVGGRDLHHVHGDQLDRAHHLANGTQQLTGEQTARLRRSGPRREARVQHVDIDGEVDDLRTVQRLGDGIGHHGLRATRFDLRHEVPAHPLGAHPGDRLGWRPVAAESDLHEIPSFDDPRLDEPAHGGAVRAEDAPGAVGRIGMCIEVHHAKSLWPDRLGDRRGGREGDRVVPAQDDRNRPAGRDLQHLAPDHLVTTLQVGGRHGRVAGVDAVEPVEGLDPQLQRVEAPGVIGRGSNRAGSEPGTRAVADPVVEGSADDRHVGPAFAQRRAIGQQRKLLEGCAAHVGGQVEVVVGRVRILVGGGRMLVVLPAPAQLVGHGAVSTLLRIAPRASAVAVRSRPAGRASRGC